ADQQTVTRTADESQGSFNRPTQNSIALQQQLRVQGGLPQFSSDPLAAAADTLAQNPDLESAVLDNPDFAYDIESLLPPAIADQPGQDPTFKRKVARSLLTNARTMSDLDDMRLDALAGKDCHLMSEFNDRTLVQVAYSESTKRQGRITEIMGSG